MSRAIQRISDACNKEDGEELERRYRLSKKGSNKTILTEWKRGFAETRGMSAGDAAARVREREEQWRGSKGGGGGGRGRSVRWGEVEGGGEDETRREVPRGGGSEGLTSLMKACRQFRSGEGGSGGGGGSTRLGLTMDHVLRGKEKDAEEERERKEALWASASTAKSPKSAVRGQGGVARGLEQGGNVEGSPAGKASMVVPGDAWERARREGERLSLVEERLRLLEETGDDSRLRSPYGRNEGGGLLPP